MNTYPSCSLTLLLQSSSCSFFSWGRLILTSLYRNPAQKATVRPGKKKQMFMYLYLKIRKQILLVFDNVPDLGDLLFQAHFLGLLLGLDLGQEKEEKGAGGYDLVKKLLPRMVKMIKQTRLLIRPKTKVPSRLPKICEDIIKAQNRPNSSLFLFQLATLLVQAPWATQRADAEKPHKAAPALTITQTKVWLIYTFVTIKSPVAQNTAYPNELKNIVFLYPTCLMIYEVTQVAMENEKQMNKMAVCPRFLYPQSSYSFETMFCRELKDVNMIMKHTPRQPIRKYCWDLVNPFYYSGCIVGSYCFKLI